MRGLSELAVSLPLAVLAWPASFSCDFNCMTALEPGAAFGMMGGVPNYGPAPTGSNCQMTCDDAPAGGYIDGQQYSLTVTSTTSLAQKVVANEHATFVAPSAGSSINTYPTVLTATYTFTASGSGDAVFHALCGAGGATNEMWIADALTVSRDGSQAAAAGGGGAATPTAAPTANEPASSEATVDLTGDGLGVASWTRDAENIYVSLTFTRSTWVAFGWSSGSALSMEGGGDGSDIVACHSDPPVVKRYWLTSKAQPTGGVDVSGATCVREGGSTTLTFQRALAATGNQRAVTPGTLQPIIYSYGEDGSFTFGYHGASNRGGSSVDFASGVFAEAEKKNASAALFAHIIFMIVSWGCLLPWGVAVASRARTVVGAAPGAWFARHRCLQTAGLAWMIIGFVCIVVHINSEQSVHFNTEKPHTLIGAFVLILGLMQPLNAFFRPHPTKDGESKTMGRLAFEILHKGGGRLACLLGILNIIAGILLLVKDDYNTTVIATASTLAVLCFAPIPGFFGFATLRPDNGISKLCVSRAGMSQGGYQGQKDAMAPPQQVGAAQHDTE